jgi:hypothetical protein
MGDAHGSAAQRIDVLEKRLASLHDLGIDTAGLRSQLTFARTHLGEGRVDEVVSICDDIEVAARRLAEGSGGEQRVRTGRFTRDQLAEAIRDTLAGGLFSKLLAEHRGGPDLRLEARLRSMDESIRSQMASEADALRAEQQVVREEIEQLRRSLDSAPASTSAPVSAVKQDDAAASANVFPDTNANTSADTSKNQEPLWASRLHRLLVKAIRRADTQATQIAGIVQQFAAHVGTNAESITPKIEALRRGISEGLQQELKQFTEHLPTISDHQPSWIAPLVQSLQAVADRLQAHPSRHNEATSRTASAICEQRDAHDHQPTDVIHAAITAESAGAVEPTTARQANVPPSGEKPETKKTIINKESAPAPDWAGPLAQSLQAIVERLQQPTVSDSSSEPAWTAPLIATLQAVAERVQMPPTPTHVVEAEPAWVAALVGNLQAMAERLPVAAVDQQTHPSDLASALSAVVDRGLEGLGELIRQGQQSGSQTISSSAKTSAALSPINIPAQEEATTREFNQSSTRADNPTVQVTPALSDSLRALVIDEIEARIGHGHTSVVNAKELKPEQVRALIDAEFERRAGGAIERNDINDLRANFIHLLPNLLEEEAVRQQLFAVLALESTAKPGALAELTGLRSFLKRELAKAAEEIAGRLQTT